MEVRAFPTDGIWFAVPTDWAIDPSKGATSRNVQRVVEVRADCDGDTLLVLVQQTGPACHTGERSCFSRPIEEDPC